MYYVVRQNLDGTVNVLDTEDCTIESVSIDTIKNLLDKGINIVGAITFCGQVEIILQPLVYFDVAYYSNTISVMHLGYDGEYSLANIHYSDVSSSKKIVEDEDGVEEIIKYLNLCPLNVTKVDDTLKQYRDYKVSEKNIILKDSKIKFTLHTMIRIFDREVTLKLFGGKNFEKCIRYDNKVPCDYMYVSHSYDDEGNLTIIIYDKTTNITYELGMFEVIKLLYFENLNIDGITFEDDKLTFNKCDFSNIKNSTDELLKQKIIMENTYKDSDRKNGQLIIYKGDEEIVIDAANIEVDEFNEIFDKLLFKSVDDYNKFKSDYYKASTSWYAKKKVLGRLTVDDELAMQQINSDLDSKFKDKILIHVGKYSIDFADNKIMLTDSNGEPVYDSIRKKFIYVTPQGNYPIYVLRLEHMTQYGLRNNNNYMYWVYNKLDLDDNKALSKGEEIELKISKTILETPVYPKDSHLSDETEYGIQQLGYFEQDDNYTEKYLKPVDIRFDNKDIYINVLVMKTNYEYLPFKMPDNTTFSALYINSCKLQEVWYKLTSESSKTVFVDDINCYSIELETCRILVPVELSSVEM